MRKYVLSGILLLCVIVIGITFSPNGDVNEMYDMYLSTNNISSYKQIDSELWEEFQIFSAEVAERGGLFLEFPLRPRDGAQIYITSLPGPRTLANSGSYHTGVDLAIAGNPKIADVVSASDGVITFCDYRPPVNRYSGGHQLHVKTTLQSGIQVTFKYLHLERTPDFKVGDRIKAGDFIGNWGHSGDETITKKMGVHLHFEVEVGSGQPNLEESLESHTGYVILNPFEQAYFVYNKETMPGIVLLQSSNTEYPIRTQ